MKNKIKEPKNSPCINPRQYNILKGKLISLNSEEEIEELTFCNNGRNIIIKSINNDLTDKLMDLINNELIWLHPEEDMLLDLHPIDETVSTYNVDLNTNLKDLAHTLFMASSIFFIKSSRDSYVNIEYISRLLKEYETSIKGSYIPDHELEEDEHDVQMIEENVSEEERYIEDLYTLTVSKNERFKLNKLSFFSIFVLDADTNNIRKIK